MLLKDLHAVVRSVPGRIEWVSVEMLDSEFATLDTLADCVSVEFAVAHWGDCEVRRVCVDYPESVGSEPVLWITLEKGAL